MCQDLQNEEAVKMMACFSPDLALEIATNVAVFFYFQFVLFLSCSVAVETFYMVYVFELLTYCGNILCSLCFRITHLLWEHFMLFVFELLSYCGNILCSLCY